MKKIVTLLLISIPLLATAQAKSNVSPYAKGAVNTENGMVVFEKSIEDKTHSQAQLFQTMKDFLGTLVVMSENEDRSKVTKEDSGNGILEAKWKRCFTSSANRGKPMPHTLYIQYISDVAPAMSNLKFPKSDIFTTKTDLPQTLS